MNLLHNRVAAIRLESPGCPAGHALSPRPGSGEEVVKS